MPVYCNYQQWLEDQKSAADFYQALKRMCVLSTGINCNTFIMPNAELQKKLVKLSQGSKHERRDFLKAVQSHMLQIDLHDKRFQPGTYKNNLGQGVVISAPSGGVFEIKSGKGHTTSAKVKINTSFEPDLQFRSDEDRHNCVADLVSGEIATDGDMYTGSHNPKMEGASELAADDCNEKLEAWNAIINSVAFDLETKCPAQEPTFRMCGLLTLLTKYGEETPEHKDCAKIIHTALAYEPLACLYILMQPYSSNQLMPKRLNDEWAFAPTVCEDPKSLIDNFKQMFPCAIDMGKRDSIISEIKSGIGADKLYNLQDAYAKHCSELFSGINYPCEMKLWCDEVCYYICKRMCHIRKTNDKSAFVDMCNTLREVFPGNDHAKESRIADDKFWEGFDREKEMSEISGFLSSFCCFQCCPNDSGLSNQCAEHLKGSKPSKYLKMLVKLNS